MLGGIITLTVKPVNKGNYVATDGDDVVAAGTKRTVAQGVKEAVIAALAKHEEGPGPSL